MTPKVYQEFVDCWRDPLQRETHIHAYVSQKTSFVPLLPEHLLQLSAQETLNILRTRFGSAIDVALSPEYVETAPCSGALPEAIRSAAANEPDCRWLQRCNMVGVNVRALGNFWNLVTYALTLPQSQDAIQLLPIWEPGVVGSLYGMSSWELNPEFFSAELAERCPHLNTTERQLRAVVNLLHVMGKTVGMDVVPHTDRFSQMVLSYPEYFEWLQRQDAEIISHDELLFDAVQQKIMTFLAVHGAAVPDEPIPTEQAVFFSEKTDEARRLRILFGQPADVELRQTRRNLLIQYLFSYGYEPMPATMAPPFRGMTPDRREEAKAVDGNGMIWRDFVITKPQAMSRVFGPLARYKLYHPRNRNRDWELDFDRPYIEAWKYVCEHYADAQRRYGLDFMRGDMAHVQMRSGGVPSKIDRYYDILGAVKQYVQEVNNAPFFGYFAETFLAPRDVFGYGEELDHLEAASADATLGDLQSTCVGSPVFLQRFRQYLDWGKTRGCTPSFTLMTGDKDDPRFDEFYRHGSEARLFIALFLTDMPSYMGAGFETRDIHYAPAPNEHYTKLFVFHETAGPKATNGPYVWGKNGVLFSRLTRLRVFAESIWAAIRGAECRWLIAPDTTGDNPVIAWTQQTDPRYLFIVNTSPDRTIGRMGIPLIPQAAQTLELRLEFSTLDTQNTEDVCLTSNGKHYQLSSLLPGEGRVYRVSSPVE